MCESYGRSLTALDPKPNQMVHHHIAIHFSKIIVNFNVKDSLWTSLIVSYWVIKDIITFEDATKV